MKKLDSYKISTMETIYHICTIRDISIVCDHDDRIARLSMERIDEVHDRHSVPFVEIPCRLIGEEIGDIGDECSCDSDSLLLAS